MNEPALPGVVPARGWAALVAGALAVAPSVAHADPTPTTPATSAPSGTPATSDSAATPAPKKGGLFNAEGEVPAIPTPSPVVLGGKPTEHDRVGTLLDWQFRRFTTFDYVVTGAAAGVTLASAILKPRSTHSFSGGFSFDASVRNALRAHEVDTRYTFRDASDVGLSLAVTWPFFVDSLATAWWYRGSRDVAQEMGLVSLQTLAISGAVQGTTNVLVSRERPYGDRCGTPELPADSNDCEGSNHYRSFFSGHTAFSFTSAALICINHFENDLLGTPYDALSCAGGYAVAAATSTFRIVADVHYASDVIAGALLGTAIGYGVPLLHYHRIDVGRFRAGSVDLQIVPSTGGAGVVGTF